MKSRRRIRTTGIEALLVCARHTNVVISDDKIADEAKWDGLKGYITNTEHDAEKVIAENHGLWVEERAFRISKESLEMRPMFHFTERRIEAHIRICFIVYKVYKELERIIKKSNIDMSVGHVLDAAKTITTIRVRMPENGQIYSKTLFLTDRHGAIQQLFELVNNQN